MHIYLFQNYLLPHLLAVLHFRILGAFACLPYFLKRFCAFLYYFFCNKLLIFPLVDVMQILPFAFLLFRVFFAVVPSFSLYCRTLVIFLCTTFSLCARWWSFAVFFAIFLSLFFLQFIVLVDIFVRACLLLYLPPRLFPCFFYYLNIFFLHCVPLLRPLLLPLVLSGRHIRVCHLAIFLHCVHTS